MGSVHELGNAGVPVNIAELTGGIIAPSPSPDIIFEISVTAAAENDRLRQEWKGREMPTAISDAMVYNNRRIIHGRA